MQFVINAHLRITYLLQMYGSILRNISIKRWQRPVIVDYFHNEVMVISFQNN